jgi:cation:H+ antiporter
MFTSTLVIVITGFVIYFSGKKFSTTSSEIGDYFNLSPSVKGATLDAVASTFPELMITIFSVLVFKEFDIGIGVITGSVLFNTLVIPSIAVLISPVVFRVGKEVISRDVIFYSISVVIFLLGILYSKSWGLVMAIILIAIYFWYIDIIIDQTEEYRNNHKQMLGEKISVIGKILSAFLNMIIMGVATYFLTEHAVFIAHALKISPFIVGFSVVAFTTSVPNIIIAVVNTKRGRVDDVMSGIFGANIFTILMVLGLPLFLYFVLTGKDIIISTSGIELVAGLILSTIMIILFIIDDYVITKKNAIIMILVYIGFIGFISFKAFLG